MSEKTDRQRLEELWVVAEALPRQVEHASGPIPRELVTWMILLAGLVAAQQRETGHA